jgi:hypothetical protein
LFNFKNDVNVSLILNAKIPLNLNSNFYGFDVIAVIQKEFKYMDLISNIGTIYENNQFKNQIYLGNCLSLNLSKKSAIFIEDFCFFGNKIKHGNILGYTFASSLKTQLDFSIGFFKLQIKKSFWWGRFFF